MGLAAVRVDAMTNPHDTKGVQPTSFTDPPMEPECEYCAGVEVLEVGTVMCASGEERDYPFLYPDSERPEIPCPWCQGG
jgi:hypothetical protein